MNKKIIAKLVEAIYYYDSPKVYRPNIKELGSRTFFCPRCKGKLFLPRQRALKPLYVCPSCKFKIPYEQVLNDHSKIEEYMAENKRRKSDG